MDSLASNAFPSALRKFRLTNDGTTYRVRLPEKEEFRLREIFDRNEYFVPGFRKLESPCVLDVGANVGLFALYARFLNPSARIECFEPAANAFALLERNVAQLDGIRVHRHGLHNFTGKAEINISSLSTGQSSVKDVSESQVADRQVIDMLEARSVVERHDSVDVLKIDTEGCEYEILENIASHGLLDRIGFILLEYHSELDRRRIDALLHGFTVFGLSTVTVNRGLAKYVRTGLLGSDRCSELTVEPPL